MSQYAPKRTSYDTVDRRWIVDITKLNTRGVEIDDDMFIAAAAYAVGDVVPSGTQVAIITATNLAAPFNNAGAGGAEVVAGYLVNDVKLETGGRHHVAIANGGPVKHGFLPATHDPAGEADLPAITRA